MVQNAKVSKVKVTHQGYPYRSLQFLSELCTLVPRMLKKLERDIVASFCDSAGKPMHFQRRNVINN